VFLLEPSWCDGAFELPSSFFTRGLPHRPETLAVAPCALLHMERMPAVPKLLRLVEPEAPAPTEPA
jgi:hypothetical protein